MFVLSPNLPDKPVKSAVIDCRMPEEIVCEIKKCGIKPIKTTIIRSVNPAVSGHPDMQFLYVGNGMFYSDKEAGSYLTDFEDAKIIYPDIELSSKYPEDIHYNVLIVGEYAVGHTENKVLKLLKDKKQICSKQGYSKCSVLAVNSKAVITDDENICRLLKNSGFDVLLISKGDIKLPGFDFGFIGGAGGLIDRDKMAFFGNIRRHRDGENIISFLNNYGIVCESLTDSFPTDFGSLIQITE